MFKKEFRKSIRYKFLSVISSILFISTFVLTTVIAINGKKMLKHSLMTKGQSFASYIAKLSTDPLIMKDNIQLDSFVNEANKDEDVLYIIIQDDAGNPVTSQYASINYQSPRLKTILLELSKDNELPDIIAAIKKRGAVTEISVPILTGADTIGKVTVCLSEQRIHQQMIKTILFVIALNTVLAFTLGFVLFFASKKIIITPIIELADAAGRLAKGDLSAQVTIKTGGEVKMLVDSFNEMAQNLEKTTVSKDYVDNIIKSMIDTLIVVSPEGKIIRVNVSACTLLGYEENELIGQPIEMICELGSADQGDKFHEIFTKDAISSVEKTYLAKNGRKIPVLFSASVMRDSNNIIQGIVCVAQDITERKRAEEKLSQLKHEHKMILQSVREGILGLDLEGKQTFVNPSAAKMLGYKVEELLGHPSHTIWHHSKPDGTPYPEEECPIYAAYKNGTIYSRDDEVFWRKDGTSFPVGYTSTPIRENDKLTGSVVVFRDITERKQAEAALRESKEKVSQILNFTAEGIYGLDLMGECTFCNPSCIRILGYHDENDLIGKNMHDLIHSTKADGTSHPRDECIVYKVLNKREYIHSDKEFLRRADGKNFPAEYWIHPIVKDNKVIGAVVAFVDITERVTLESQLRHALKMEAVGQLAGGVAHDFNNMLSAIIGYGHISLMKMATDNPLRRNIESMLEAADRAARLTQELLTFSRKQIIDRKPVDLNMIIGKVEKFLVRVIGEDIECKTLLQKEPIWVFADSHQLEQVLMNLAINARDAMPGGGSFTVTTEHLILDDEFITIYGYVKPGMYALITVTDTGTGIDEETRHRIFEPFFTTKEMGKGTGLGLAVIYGIIKQHDGYINVYSEPGMGTTFRIYLPVIASGVVEEKTAPEAENPDGGTETILLAEDDEPLRKLAKLVLRRFGYEVIEAFDGEDAVKTFMENKDRIQLLLFDLVMPKKSGKEAYDEIRKIKPDIKGIFVSGYSPDIVQQKASLENGVSIIFKPVLPVDLLKKVRSVLDENKT